MRETLVFFLLFCFQLFHRWIDWIGLGIVWDLGFVGNIRGIVTYTGNPSVIFSLLPAAPPRLIQSVSMNSLLSQNCDRTHPLLDMMDVGRRVG